MQDSKPSVDELYHDYNKNKIRWILLRDEMLLVVITKFLVDATIGVILSQLMTGYIYSAADTIGSYLAIGILLLVSLYLTREVLLRFTNTMKAGK
jgi:hypothetical protein